VMPAGIGSVGVIGTDVAVLASVSGALLG
jgi:hypothetical protein